MCIKYESFPVIQNKYGISHEIIAQLGNHIKYIDTSYQSSLFQKQHSPIRKASDKVDHSGE